MRWPRRNDAGERYVVLAAAALVGIPLDQHLCVRILREISRVGCSSGRYSSLMASLFRVIKTERLDRMLFGSVSNGSILLAVPAPASRASR